MEKSGCISIMNIEEFKKEINHEMLALTVVFERLGFALTGYELDAGKADNYETLHLTRKLF